MYLCNSVLCVTINNNICAGAWTWVRESTSVMSREEWFKCQIRLFPSPRIYGNKNIPIFF